MTPDDILLTDKVAVVTGGGTGIGRGIARGFANFGARVAIWELDPHSCAAAAGEVGGLSLPTDVRVPSEVDEALQATVDELGGVDILVNNAGGTFSSPFLDTNERGWAALHRANLEHVLLCSHRCARQMVAQGRGGSIINVASIEGLRAAPGYAVYAAAKAAVLNFTRTLALELASDGIRVNALAPDMTLTQGLEALAGKASLERMAHTVPLGRLGSVDDMAAAAIFLASGLSAYVTGETLHVDGGTHASSGWYHHPKTGKYQIGPTE